MPEPAGTHRKASEIFLSRKHHLYFSRGGRFVDHSRERTQVCCRVVDAVRRYDEGSVGAKGGGVDETKKAATDFGGVGTSSGKAFLIVRVAGAPVKERQNAHLSEELS